MLEIWQFAALGSAPLSLKPMLAALHYYKSAAGLYPPNGLTGQMLFSLPHANPMEQSPIQLPQKLPILKYTRQGEIEILSDVIYIHQPMFPAKCYCFTVAKTNAQRRVTSAGTSTMF